MLPDEIVAWNQFVSALLLVVLTLVILVWAIPSHCGAMCQRCRPTSQRKH